MSTTTMVYPADSRKASGRSFADEARIYGKEIRYEFLKLLRTRTFSLATIGFPVMFYVLFGVSNAGSIHGDVQVAKYMLGGYACFGLVGAALFGIGVGMATEINAGWLEVKRASPMPPMAYLLAKCCSAIGFGLVIVSVLIVIAMTMAHVRLSGLEIAKMYSLTVVGATAFASMGLLLAQIVPAASAPAIVNLIYLPMSFLSGLWIPLRLLPHWVQSIAPALPTYHLAQLMVGVYGQGYTDGTAAQTHWLGLLGFSLVMVGASWAVFYRAQERA